MTCLAVNGHGEVSAPFDESSLENEYCVALHVQCGDFDYFQAGDLTGGGGGASLTVDAAKDEKRRAMAVALEQEMKAKVQEMQAKVVEAQAQVPLAMAETFRSGNLGVMDYMRLKNIESDTDMRQSIAKPDDSKDPS